MQDSYDFQAVSRKSKADIVKIKHAVKEALERADLDEVATDELAYMIAEHVYFCRKEWIEGK